MPNTFDVAIVGYGPTGLEAASLLGSLGHKVVVCERWPSLYGLPRLTHIDDESARLIQRAGDIEAALRDSSPTDYVWVNGEGKTLLKMPPPSIGPLGFPAHISMYQPDIEDAIDARIRSCGNVTVWQGWAVTDVSQNDEGVTLSMAPWLGSTVDASRSDSLRAAYVIAADGSKSLVRSTLGIERDDLGFGERWVNIDCEWLRPMPAEFAISKQFCDPRRGHMYMGIGHHRQRFEFAAHPDEEREQLERPEVAWDWLRATHDLGPDDLKIVRQILYVFEARIAKQWRVGRVLLAGDAAHTMPPYLGQGACGGIRDAANLAWKLDLVLRGLADQQLLDSYELERRPHVTALTHMSIGLGRIANMHDSAAAAQRDAAFFAGQVPPPPVMPSLTAGILASSADGAVANGAGILGVQGRISSDGREVLGDELIGSGFHLVCREDPSAALSADQCAFLEELHCSIVHFGAGGADDVEGRYGGFLDAHEAAAYVERPDLVVFGFAHAESDIGRLVDELHDQLAARSLKTSMA